MPTNSNTKDKKIIKFIKELFTKIKRKKLKPKVYKEEELTAGGYTPAPTHLCKEYKKRK